MKAGERKSALQKGETRYFTGKPCKYGHIAERFACDGACVSCQPAKRKRIYENNREQILSNQRLKRSLNPEYDREFRRRKQPEYRNQKRVAQLRRHAKQQGAEGSFTKDDLDFLWLLQEGLCSICQIDLNTTGFHIDHKTPLSRGGSNWPSNLQLLCPTDNLRKQTQTDEEYRQKLGLSE